MSLFSARSGLCALNMWQVQRSLFGRSNVDGAHELAHSCVSVIKTKAYFLGLYYCLGCSTDTQSFFDGDSGLTNAWVQAKYFLSMAL